MEYNQIPQLHTYGQDMAGAAPGMVDPGMMQDPNMVDPNMIQDPSMMPEHYTQPVTLL